MFPERRNAWIVPAEGDRVPADTQSNATARDRLPPAERLAKLREKVRRTWNEFADAPLVSSTSTSWPTSVSFENEVAHYHVAHHRAHAASAFHLSGLTEPAAILTCDGKGDGLSATIYRGEILMARLTYLRGSTANDSVGLFYQAVTEALGFVPVDGEYKTMGLAAFGQVLGRAESVRRHRVCPRRHPGVVAHVDVRQLQRATSGAEGQQPALLGRAGRRVPDVCSDASRIATSPHFAQAHLEEVMLQLAADAMRHRRRTPTGRRRRRDAERQGQCADPRSTDAVVVLRLS